MLDERKNTVTIEILGIDKISTPMNPIDMKTLSKLFTCSNVSNLICRREGGEIDLLIGMQYAAYHPVRIESNGHLLLMKNRFGFVIAGSHPNIKETTKILVQHAVVLHASSNTNTFYDIESLGVSCIPKCGSCACGKCHTGGKDMSIQDELELEMIQSNLSFNKHTGRWQAAYPWIKSPHNLPNNRNYALGTLFSTEKRLKKKKDYADLYARQINDMINRGAARIVTEAELDNYTGAKFYIAHHAVMKPDSKSTPCRIVFNSSAKFYGVSLNDCLAKGPSLLNQLLGILLRFRENHVAFVGDISKMFHSIEIPIQDQMTHLFLWRDFENKEPDTFAMTRVNMGDRPSSAIAQSALQKTAEEALQNYPAAANLILQNSYMDDMPGSVDNENEALQVMNDIETILSRKGFRIKEWVWAGAKGNLNESTADQKTVQIITETDCDVETEKVLGLLWDIDNDALLFKLNLNPTNCKKKVTKREILSIVNSIYDPMGLLCPITVRAKIIMRRIWASFPGIKWDDELPVEIVKEWSEIFEDLKIVHQLQFPRSVKPKDAIGKPMLVIFSDGSSNAYGTVAYARWETRHGSFSSRLIAAKSRVAPIKVIDIVRLELCGAVLSKRLRETIEKEIEVTFTSVHHLIDSEIVKAMICRQSYGFNTFAANRLGEIQRATNDDEWSWLSGKLNISDLTTRGCSVEELLNNNEWIYGPEFLKKPVSEWPVKQSTSVISIPELKAKTHVAMTANAISPESLAKRIDATRFSKWLLLKHTTARVLKLYKRFKFHGSKNDTELLPIDLEEGEFFWIKEAQRDILKNLSTARFVKLNPTVNERGIVVVGGRTERWMQSTWNKQEFILLPKDHHISTLILRHMHKIAAHPGVASTIARVRSKYWIIGISRLARSMVNKCVTCIAKAQYFASQQMSPLPIERIKPSPPFCNVVLDYFGPYTIRGEVQKRIRGKAYGIIITCAASRAVYLDVANDYSTDGFLQVFRRFTSLRGWPQKMFSDKGSQLVGASKELISIVKGLDWNEIQRYGYKHGLEWSFSPGNAPWYNGAAEALVKSVKRSLSCAIGDQILSFSELQTCLFETAQLVNQRPIGSKPCEPNQGGYLSPNDLLLGRSTSEVPQGPFKERASLSYRFDFIQSIVNSFWKRWSRDVFPNLVIRPKWHTKCREVKVGDIVILQDSNVVRGEWKKAIVTETMRSEDGLVRRIILEYTSGSTRIKVERPVQKVIVLVPVDESGGGSVQSH